MGDYKEKIESLLSKYEDGKDIFINAQKAKNWDYPIKIKSEFAGDHTLPKSWLELVERTFAILAEEKYGLDCYDNQIEVIRSDQMLDAYASHGMPVSYEHWSFGKQRIMEEQAYKKGQKGLAYEIVVNTDPAIAYCMENNTPLMQMLVIAHASFGHNNFFKRNHMFRQFTRASTIVDDLRMMRDFVRECEEEYGVREVEKVLDACHALKLNGFDRYTKPEAKSADEKKEKAKQDYARRAAKAESGDIYRSITAKNDFDDSAEVQGFKAGDGEQNLLRYIADHAPHLQPWQRKIMRMSANTAQYFYPNMQTKLMNEGWASFWHYTLLHDMEEMGLIDAGMMQEFLDSHSSVLFQPEYDETRTVRGPDGQPKKINIYNGINPYALGFAMFQDIKRICEDPTEEDREWFPQIAGKGNWLETLKFAMENFKDESFVQQYLSPTVMRKFKFFSYENDETNPYYEVTAIHDEKGFRQVRDDLAAQYRLSDNLPHIEVAAYHDRTDRRLVLRHFMREWKMLDEKNTDQVLKHIYQLWGHPVIMESIDDDGDYLDQMSCPPDYEVPEDAHPGPNPY